MDGPAIILATDTVQDLTLPPTAVLAVTVKDPTSDPVGGAPLANQRICLNGCGPSTMTDGAGSFSIGGIAPGSYYIYLDGGGGATLPDSFYLSGPYVSFSTDVMQDLTVPTITLTVTVSGDGPAEGGSATSASLPTTLGPEVLFGRQRSWPESTVRWYRALQAQRHGPHHTSPSGIRGDNGR